MSTADLFGPFGTLAAVTFAVIAFTTGRVITLSHHRDVISLQDKRIEDMTAQLKRSEEREQYWRQLALSGTSLAAKAVTLAKEAKQEGEAV